MSRLVDSHGSGLTPEERFEQIYKATYRKTVAYALRRTAQEADAHDIVANTYLVAWRRLDELLGVNEPQAWLYAVAYRMISNSRRSKGRNERLATKAAALGGVSAGLDPAWSAEKRDDYDRVLKAMSQLSEDDQEILRLVAWEDLSHSDIAVVLGFKAPLVRSRLFRARRRLEAELGTGSALPGGRSGHVSDTEDSVDGTRDAGCSDE